MEKLPLSSKKFLAYLIADIGWKLILGILIWKNCEGENQVLLLSIVCISGFVQTGYILGQAALDRYVRLAQITAKTIKGEDNVSTEEHKNEKPQESIESASEVEQTDKEP